MATLHYIVNGPSANATPIVPVASSSATEIVIVRGPQAGATAAYIASLREVGAVLVRIVMR